MNSEKIESLIKKSLENSSAGQSAANDLILLGNEALPQIIEALNNLTIVQYPVNLSKTLYLIESPEKHLLLINALKNGKVGFLISCFEILGSSQLDAAYSSLISYLENTENLDALRALAADALGEFQDETAIPILLKTLEETGSNDLGLSIVIALAKLGNNEKSSIALNLAVSKKDPTIRPKATEALKYVVVPELFSTAVEVLNDKYVEMRINAFNALFYIGSGKSIEVLLKHIKSKNPIISNTVLKRLEDLTGISFIDFSGKELESWWKINEPLFEKDVCYRFGKPVSIQSIAESAINEKNQSSVMEELRIITGVDFTSKKFTEIERINEQSTKIKKWLNTGGGKNFEIGQLYKYGRKQSLETALK